MKTTTNWILAGVLAVAASLVFAQQPAPPAGGPQSFGPSGRGGFGGSGRGRGGGGGGGFVANPHFDTEAPVLPADLKSGGILIYSKTNGFREEAAVQASDTALAAIAHERGWPYYWTENGAIMNRE